MLPAGDGRSTRVAVARLQSFAHESEIDVAINEPQQMIFGKMIFDSKIVKNSASAALSPFATATFHCSRGVNEPSFARAHVP